MKPTDPSPATSTPTACVDAQTLERYLAEHLDESDEVRVEAHLETCDACRRTMELQAAEPEVWTELAAGVPDVLPAATLPGSDSEEGIQVDEVISLLDPTDDPAYLGRIGAYEISGVIGGGATGVVLKAMEPRLNRFVAIKLMSPRYRHHGAARSRFEREGKAVAAVSDEHVVQVFAVDDHRGLPFIVMQYVAGPSLQQRLDQDGPLDTNEVTRIGLQVAKGLAAAHAQGIIHRDVKPANVLLQANVDRALVTDFGLARVADEAALTRSGTIAGTPQYMSPEQARGDAVDTSSDLFSLGSLMYAATTARPPFRAENVYGVIRRVCESKPRPIRELQPAIDPWLQAFVEKLMEKSAAERFGSAAEVADRLGEELAHLQSPTLLPEPPRAWWHREAEAPASPNRKRILAWCAGGLVILLGAWGINGTEKGRALRGSLFFGITSAFSSSAQDDAGEVLGEGWSVVAEAESQPNVQLYALTETRFMEADGLESAVVKIDRGDVDIVVGEPGVVTLRSVRRVRAANAEAAAISISGHTVQLAQEEGAAILRDAAEITGVGATYRLVVPEGMGVDVTTRAGHVTLGDGVGAANLVANGSAVVGQLTGDLDARTNGGGIQMTAGFAHKAEVLAVGGDVHVASLTGEIWARTSNGDAYLSGNPGTVTVQTSGGDIHVDGIDGTTGGYASVGDVLVNVHATPSAVSLFSATGGNVEVILDDEVDATLHVRGEVDSAIEFALEDPGDGRLPYSAAQIGEGSAEPIQVTMVSGRVAVRVEDLGASDGPLDQPTEGDAPRDTGDGQPTEGEVVLAGGDESGPADTPGGSGSSGSSDDSGLGGSGSGLGGSGLGGIGLGGSGLGGSGLGGSGLGGSGSGSSAGGALPPISNEARARMVSATNTPAQPGVITTVAFEEPIGNIDGYTLYLPRSYGEREGLLPVLVYLQGAFGVGGEIEDLHHWGLARLLRDETDLSIERNRMLLDEFIVVCPHSAGGQYHSAPEAMTAILEALERDYRADPRRFTVTGLSIGGHGCWGLASRLPGRFAAIAPMGSDTFAVESLAGLGDVAIWMSHNVTDSIVEIGSVERAATDLEAIHRTPFRRMTHAEMAGSDLLDHKYVFTSSVGGGHDAWTDVYLSDVFYAWLLKQTLPVASEER